MDKRARVGLIYSYNENWIGGTYYILNLIKALNLVDDSRKPEIVLLTEEKENVDRVRSETKYPYIDTTYIKYPVSLSLFKRAVNKLTSPLGIKIFSTKIENPNVDFFYPKFPREIKGNALKKIYWIPDFQEAFLPGFFTEHQIQRRKIIRNRISQIADFLVFSSEDSRRHFNDLYPDSNAEQFVLNFSVTHPNLEGYDDDQILSKYGIGKEFFFIPNQFWAHKNHLTALEALKKLKQEGHDFHFIFSGKEHDHRSKDYVQKIKSFVADHNLEDNAKFLGFIPRDEQLIILRNSLAVIQPSLFEGWSTVVEDAKAQNKFLFLSDLPVHFEQAKENCVFFERLNPEDLANKLINTQIIVKEKCYSQNIEKFGLDFLEIIKKNTIATNLF